MIDEEVVNIRHKESEENEDIKRNEKVNCDNFQKRYEHLLSQEKKLKNISWKVVLQEMETSLIEYRTMKESSLEKVKNYQQLLKSEKIAANCVSLASKIFRQKFKMLEIEINISKITDELRENIKDFLPYIHMGILAVRMIEIMLYSMCTVCEEYKGPKDEWCFLAENCFTNHYATKEIKMASSILLCNLDKNIKYLTLDIFAYLNDALYNEQLCGFKSKNIKWSIIQVQDHFQLDNKIKKYAKERDSGYKSEEESLKKIKMEKKSKIPDIAQTKKESTSIKVKSFFCNSFVSTIIGVVVGILLVWFLKK